MTKVTDRYLEARRQEILDAARRVFVDKGYAAATMNDIAAEAGVAAGSLYRYFENKADLIAEVAHLCVHEDMETWRSAPAPGATPGEAFFSLGQSVRAQREQPEYADLCVLRLESYLAGSRDPDLQRRLVETLDESVDNLAGFIKAAQDSGEFEEGVDTLSLARFLHAFGAGVGAMSTVYGPTFAAGEAWDLLIQFVGGSFVEDVRQRMQARAEAAPPSDAKTEGTPNA